MLGGAGTVAANVTSSGSVAPGTSSGMRGTLTIHGNCTQNRGGLMTIDLGGRGARPGRMYINPSEIVFFEPVGRGLKVAQLLVQAKP